MTLKQNSLLSPNDKPPNAMLKLILKLLLLMGFIVGIAWIVVTHQQKNQDKKEGQKFDLKSMPMPVLVAKAQQKDVNVYLDALGTVTPRNAVVVKSQIGGQLLNVYFKEGQHVKKGDLLAQIDSRPYENQLAQAEGQFSKDKALLDNALIDANRYQVLLNQDSVAKQVADTQEALVRQYRAAVVIDQSQINSAKLQLNYCRVIAPISGRVGLRQIDPGNMVQPSDPLGIVSVSEFQPITVLFNIPEDKLPLVMRRMKVEPSILVDAYDREQKTRLASGSLFSVDNQIDPTTGSIKLRAQFNNDDGHLYPNQFVNVKLLVDTQKASTVILQSAVQHGKNGDFVYALNSNNTVALKSIQSGQIDGELLAVTGEVKPGDELVVDGADKLHDGAKVKVIKPKGKYDDTQKNAADHIKSSGQVKSEWRNKSSTD